MAIKNASDLLVYAKTAAPVKQKTRIRVLTNTPLLDFQNNTNIILNNITNASGAVYDNILDNIASTNTGSNLISSISLNLVGVYGYTDESGSDQIDGDYTYRDFQNGSNGIVPTLEITNGTATFEENGVIIEIITPGSSAIFDPVAFSTSASFSINMDLRDVTNKDSGGWSESLGGLKSFEMSTDALQSINPDTPLDGSDFFNKLKQDLPTNAEVNLSFSDRIRNIIRTNLTQSGVDNFSILGGISQTNLQADPFGGSTASLLSTGASTNNKGLRYSVDLTRVQKKNVNFSFYVKGQGSTDEINIAFGGLSSSVIDDFTGIILEGSGSVEHFTGIYWKVTGLSTSNWTRVSIQTGIVDAPNTIDTLAISVYPNQFNNQNNNEILTSSWQIELSPEATDYQDPTDITHWQGNALVSSLSFDAGVEDNYTCSATFTGTGNVYPNGLGPELIADTGFDDPSYWTVFPTDESLSVVENGYGKVITNSSNNISYVSTPTLITVGDYYLLEYTVAVSTAGGLLILDGWDSDNDPDVSIPATVGTHKVLIKPSITGLFIARNLPNNNVWLSSISLKKVL